MGDTSRSGVQLIDCGTSQCKKLKSKIDALVGAGFRPNCWHYRRIPSAEKEKDAKTILQFCAGPRQRSPCEPVQGNVDLRSRLPVTNTRFLAMLAVELVAPAQSRSFRPSCGFSAHTSLPLFQILSFLTAHHQDPSKFSQRKWYSSTLLIDLSRKANSTVPARSIQGCHRPPPRIVFVVQFEKGE